MEKSAHSDTGELIAKCDETKEKKKNVRSSTREAHALYFYAWMVLSRRRHASVSDGQGDTRELHIDRH